MKVSHDLNLVDKLVLEKARKYHAYQQPLWELEPGSTPEVRRVQMRWHLYAKARGFGVGARAHGVEL